MLAESTMAMADAILFFTLCPGNHLHNRFLIVLGQSWIGWRTGQRFIQAKPHGIDIRLGGTAIVRGEHFRCHVIVGAGQFSRSLGSTKIFHNA